MLPTLTLPQFDQNKNERQKQLEQMRIQYAFSLTYDGQIATINQLPQCEKPGAYYQFKALSNLIGLLPSLPGVLWKTFKHGLLQTPFKRVEDYSFFGLTPFPDPKLRTDLWNDMYMARQCVAGANPVMIEGVNASNPLPVHFKVDQATLSISHDEMALALNEERLYMVNLAMLKTLQDNPGTVDGHTKYATAPIALYYIICRMNSVRKGLMSCKVLNSPCGSHQRSAIAPNLLISSGCTLLVLVMGLSLVICAYSLLYCWFIPETIDSTF